MRVHDSTQPPAEPTPRVLLVDDEPALGRTFERILQRHGFDVHVAIDGKSAADAAMQGRFDVVLSDIDMPGLDGIELLRLVRQHDLDLPVVLMTGSPSLTTAIQAVEHGALRYLTKPIDPSALVENVRRAAQLHRMAAIKREALRLLENHRFHLGDRAGLEAAFQRAMESLWMAYQPIVRWSRRETFALEALVRCKEPTIPHPGALFDAAERLDLVHDVGRRIRSRVASAALECRDGTFFVNLHPRDLLDPELHDAEAPLSKVADRVVLEITERASLDEMSDVRGRIASLRQLGYRIALDDLGAGYAGLASFALLEPDVVKIDMSLVRDVHLHATKQKLVRSIVSLCADLKLLLVVEGVETAEERNMLVELGCDLLQGYLFARPTHPAPTVRW